MENRVLLQVKKLDYLPDKTCYQFITIHKETTGHKAFSTYIKDL